MLSVTRSIQPSLFTNHHQPDPYPPCGALASALRSKSLTLIAWYNLRALWEDAVQGSILFDTMMNTSEENGRQIVTSGTDGVFG